MLSDFLTPMFSWLKDKMGCAHSSERTINPYPFPCRLDKYFAVHSLKDVEQLAKDERNASVWHKVSPGVKVGRNYLTVRPSYKKKLKEPYSCEEPFGKPAWMLETPSPMIFDPVYVSQFRKALDEHYPEASVRDGVTASTPVEEHNGHLDSVESGRENLKIGVPPGGENKVVLYVTSLRGIRKTFEECNTMKMILQASRIHVDERDISMHSEFKKEFEELFAKRMTVPRLFVRGKYIGGVEEIQQLNEAGELDKEFEGIPRHQFLNVYERCDDVRFILCNNCYGSRKIFSDNCIWLPCPECNENGLVRCPFCLL